jgi:hypothetical protein
MTSTSTVPAIDVIQSGTVSQWRGVVGVTVTNREGDSLHGVSLFLNSAPPNLNGAQFLVADTATLSVHPGVTDGSQVTIALHDAKTVSGKSVGEFSFDLCKGSKDQAPP